MADLQNEFSWSKSRHEKFAECRRSYYFAYYGSWGGWEAQPGSRTRELYVLKKLSSRWQWAGSVVHTTLKGLLQRARSTGDLPRLEDVLERARRRARAEWAGSREKSYWRESSKIVGLVEHEYGDVVPDEDWKRLYETVVDGSLRAFYASETLERIRSTPRDRWLTVDDLDAWGFEGTKIWVAIDFAYRDDDGRVQILDWKTGKERGVDHTQIAIYALYAQRKWGVSVDGVVGGLVYLVGNGDGKGGERVSVAADAAALDACQAQMRASIAEMKGALADPARNVAVADAFPQLQGRESCRRCPFRRPCGRL
jgi:PD-(D/E)XK nuclease superfamily